MTVDSTTFSAKVLHLVTTEKESWASSIVQAASHYGIDTNKIKSLLTIHIIDELELECLSANLIKHQPKLPI